MLTYIKKFLYKFKERIYLTKLINRTFIRYLISDELYIKLRFRERMGYWPNLKSPGTFNEKLQWLKLHDRKPEYARRVDKFAVREFIIETIGEDYLIPFLGVWENFDEIDFKILPDQFVLKCTHNSGGNIFCKDKDNFNVANARKKMNRWLKCNYFYGSREWQYKNIKPRIIAEKYMVDESGEELKDYKVFCFNGIPKLLFVATDRNIDQTKFDFYDTGFNHLQLVQHYPNNENRIIQRPAGLDEMLELSTKLSKNLIHCRVDFYDINGKVYFGELTFYHFSGMEKFEPENWDTTLGSWIELPISKC
jgi:hypothetical protein